MKFKALVIALSCSALSVTAFADDEPGENENPAEVSPIKVEGGEVLFTGTIVETPCIIENNGAEQEVKLGQFRKDSFSGKDTTSSPVGFDIKLLGCAVDVYKTAAITFDGGRISGSDDILAPVSGQAGDEVAKGVGIQILQNNKVVPVNGVDTTDFINLDEGNNSFRFQARYIALGDEVSAGTANASAQFAITYQ